jgi:hypothetical protein
MEAVSAPAEILRALLEKHLPLAGDADGALDRRRHSLIAELVYIVIIIIIVMVPLLPPVNCVEDSWYVLFI